jgi:hypothetical protein
MRGIQGWTVYSSGLRKTCKESHDIVPQEAEDPNYITYSYRTEECDCEIQKKRIKDRWKR